MVRSALTSVSLFEQKDATTFYYIHNKSAKSKWASSEILFEYRMDLKAVTGIRESVLTRSFWGFAPPAS
jgi:hypothetical protein